MDDDDDNDNDNNDNDEGRRSMGILYSIKYFKGQEICFHLFNTVSYTFKSR